MAEGWPTRTVEIIVTEELWKQIEQFAVVTKGHIANVPERLLRAGLEAEYNEFPNLRQNQ